MKAVLFAGALLNALIACAHQGRWGEPPELSQPPTIDRGTPDERLTSDLRLAIARRQNFSDAANAIDIEAKDGTLTLSGPVENDDERILIEALARSTKGVKDVENDLTIEVVGH